MHKWVCIVIALLLVIWALTIELQFTRSRVILLESNIMMHKYDTPNKLIINNKEHKNY
jgi:hypothetical protein